MLILCNYLIKSQNINYLPALESIFVSYIFFRKHNILSCFYQYAMCVFSVPLSEKNQKRANLPLIY